MEDYGIWVRAAGVLIAFVGGEDGDGNDKRRFHLDLTDRHKPRNAAAVLPRCTIM